MPPDASQHSRTRRKAAAASQGQGKRLLQCEYVVVRTQAENPFWTSNAWRRSGVRHVKKQYATDLRGFSRINLFEKPILGSIRGIRGEGRFSPSHSPYRCACHAERSRRACNCAVEASL